MLGGVDVDGHGIAGVEKFFDQRLRTNPEPLRLSIDVRVQAVLRDELAHAMDEFSAIGACGIVMDVRTGEVIAMVSLPDYDANLAGQGGPRSASTARVTGMYEPGSTFKLQTAAMALDSGAAQSVEHVRRRARHPHRPLHHHRLRGQAPRTDLPEVLAYSSNLGAAHIAQAVGAGAAARLAGQHGHVPARRHRAAGGGHADRAAGRELEGGGHLTVGFGHGIAVSPLHVVRGTAALANGGIVLSPTILARDPAAGPREGIRVMKLGTSDMIRKLMRLVVTDGYGKPADIPGYFVGGKTGTAEKIGPRLQEAHQRQRVHERVPDERAAIRGVFHAGRAARQQEHRRLLDRRRGQRAGRGPGDRADRADAGAAAGHGGHARRSRPRWRSRCSRRGYVPQATADPADRRAAGAATAPAAPPAPARGRRRVAGDAGTPGPAPLTGRRPQSGCGTRPALHPVAAH